MGNLARRPGLTCTQLCAEVAAMIPQVYQDKVAMGTCTPAEKMLAVQTWTSCLAGLQICDLDHECDRMTAAVLSARCWE